jgi:hypothetical protein
VAFITGRDQLPTNMVGLGEGVARGLPLLGLILVGDPPPFPPPSSVDVPYREKSIFHLFDNLSCQEFEFSPTP